MTGNGWYLQAGLGFYRHISIVTRLERLNLQRGIATDGGTVGLGKSNTIIYGGINVGGREGAVFCAAAGMIGVVYWLAFRDVGKVDFAPMPQ